MINITIDASIFALPPKTDDSKIEYRNIQRFITNMYYLNLLVNCPHITINYMSKIPKNLNINYYYPNDLRRRIENIKKYNELIFYNPSILDFFNSIYRTLLPKKYIDQTTKNIKESKGKIGIYENIPDKDSEPDVKYKNITFNNNIYPIEFRKKLSNTFILYLGFIAYLNKKYHSKDKNYIVIDSDSIIKNEKVILCYDNYKESEVKIIGIQMVKELIKNNDIKDNTIEKIKKYVNFQYGKDIDFNVIKNYCNLEKDFNIKLNNYISTMSEVLEIFRKNSIEINNEDEWIFMLNSHGCLCSPDSNVYKVCPLKTRYFKNIDGKNEYFTLHLKPITYKIKNDLSDLTRRIYFKWNNDKVLFGWIGEHPISCSELSKKCEEVNCPQYKKIASYSNEF